MSIPRAESAVPSVGAKTRHAPCPRRFAYALILLLSLGSLHAEVLPSVTVRNTTYLNVEIVQINDSSVMFRHSRGMTSVSFSKLTTEEKQDLGLLPKPKPVAPAPQATEAKPQLHPESERPPNRWRTLDVIRYPEDRALAIAQALQLAAELQTPEGVHRLVDKFPRLTMRQGGFGLIGYCFFCICLVLICANAGQPAPVMCWVPLFQLYCLSRAAKMSPLWFGILLLDVIGHLTLLAIAGTQGLSRQTIHIAGFSFLVLAILNVIGCLIWAFKICRACGKSPIIAVGLLVPGLNLLSFLFLAFSKGVGSKIDLPSAAAAAVVRTTSTAGR
jgi:hypothetical protein